MTMTQAQGGIQSQTVLTRIVKYVTDMFSCKEEGLFFFTWHVRTGHGQSFARTHRSPVRRDATVWNQSPLCVCYTYTIKTIRLVEPSQILGQNLPSSCLFVLISYNAYNTYMNIKYAATGFLASNSLLSQRVLLTAIILLQKNFKITKNVFNVVNFLAMCKSAVPTRLFSIAPTTLKSFSIGACLS